MSFESLDEDFSFIKKLEKDRELDSQVSFVYRSEGPSSLGTLIARIVAFAMIELFDAQANVDVDETGCEYNRRKKIYREQQERRDRAIAAMKALDVEAAKDIT